MARRDEIRVSLFPFMSILACTIGALTLLLTSLSLSAVAPRDDISAVAVAAPLEPRNAGQSSRSSSSALDRKTIESIEALFAQIDRTLAARGQATGVSLETLESDLVAVRRNRDLESELARLTAAGLALDEPSETVEASIAVLESRRETLPILIDPTGLSRHLDPWFVACDAKGVTAYRARDGYEHFVAGDGLNATGEYGRYLRRLRAIPGALLVLLVRPDGLRTAEIAAGVAATAGVRVARLPLPGHGELDWTLLRRAEQGRAR